MFFLCSCACVRVFFFLYISFRGITQTTGVTVNDEAVEMFNAFKLHRAPHDNRYFVYKIENDAEIVVDTFGDKSKTYDDFTACLPANECRYGVFDLDFTTLDGRQGNKLVFISWSPDTAKIKNKMVYAASKASDEEGKGG